MPTRACFLPGAEDSLGEDCKVQKRRPEIESNTDKTQDKIVSINPATLEPIGDVSPSSSAECREAIQEAVRAFPVWKEMPLSEKQAIFNEAKQILLKRSNEIARLITVEKGSPFPESLGTEVLGALGMFDYYSQSLGKSLKPKKTKHHISLFLHKKSAFHFQPLGPTLIISPWNFPFLISICDTLSALTAGNTVVLRPSTSTPLVVLSIGEILEEAGLPPGVLNIVVSQVPQAEEMITHPSIQTIMFTGSTSTGKKIMKLASENLTNIVLELGGKDPMIVLKDADIERAVQGAVWAAFMNCGQSCGAVERVYVDQEIEKEFTEKALSLTQKLKVGNPLEPRVDIGPMATQGQLDVVLDHIEDARMKGAQVLYGGNKIENLPGYFIQPAVLEGVDHTMKIMKDETFGPVLPIMSFSTPEDAISLANDSPYGLTASVWTRDKKMASWVAERLETGTVTINDHMVTFNEPAGIWGGIKQTGIGHSHGIYGLLDLVNIKFISHDYFKRSRLVWWYPYDKTLTPFLERSLAYFHHKKLSAKIKAMLSLLPYMTKIRAGMPLMNLVKSLPRLFRK